MISALHCSLAGQEESIDVIPGTRAATAYRRGRATESYRCSFGLNPRCRAALADVGLRASTTGADGEVRILEFDEHPFFVLTLFVPQARSQRSAPHPPFVALARAAAVRMRS